MQVENGICQLEALFINKIKKEDNTLTYPEIQYFLLVSTNEDPWPMANQGSLLLGPKIDR